MVQNIDQEAGEL